MSTSDFAFNHFLPHGRTVNGGISHKRSVSDQGVPKDGNTFRRIRSWNNMKRLKSDNLGKREGTFSCRMRPKGNRDWSVRRGSIQNRKHWKEFGKIFASFYARLASETRNRAETREVISMVPSIWLLTIVIGLH